MSVSRSGGPLPAGYSPPFSIVTNDDHSAYIVIATALGMACFLVFVAARAVVRYSITFAFGRDDWLLVCSVVSIVWEMQGVLSIRTWYHVQRADQMLQAMAIIQSSILLYGCSVGLGASMIDMSLSEQIRIQKVCRYYPPHLGA